MSKANGDIYSSIPAKSLSRPGEKLIRLVAVGLKEASTDSPCFRASLLFADISINTIIHSLQGVLVFFRRYSELSANLEDLQDDFNVIFGPLGTNDAGIELVNRDIAAPCLDATVKGTNGLMRAVRKLLWVDPSIFDQVQKFLDTDIAYYVSIRQQFQTIQEKYDSLLAKYMALPKAYDPDKTKEDAFQLFEIRKQYIHLALKLWHTIKQLVLRLNTVVVSICGSMWPAVPDVAKFTSAVDGLSEAYSSVLRMQACLSMQTMSSKMLVENLKHVTESSEKAIIEIFTPTSEASDYDPSPLNNKNVFLDTSETKPQLEKHGWVFMKSKWLLTGEEVWLKRWLFVKGEVFGFLAVSGNGQYVEESDRFGVLLANFRYLPGEERKFCFEIKTMQTSLVLQVETVAELKSWLTVFRDVKAKSAEDKTGYGQLRYEPFLESFRLVPVVDVDFALVATSNGDDRVKRLVNNQVAHMHPVLSINPPLCTQTTMLSVLSHLYVSSNSVPSGPTANFWGFVNWGVYYVVSEESRKAFTGKLVPTPKSSLVMRYPKNYPYDLKMADIQLRAIFESFILPHELVLLSFKSSWAPNSSQELFCNIFMTTRALYFYTNSCGLISISPFVLSDFMFGEVVAKEKYSVIKLHLLSGLSVKMKISVGSAVSICEQLNFILKDRRSDKPLSVEKLLAELKKIRDRVKRTLEAQQKANLHPGLGFGTVPKGHFAHGSSLITVVNDQSGVGDGESSMIPSEMESFSVKSSAKSDQFPYLLWKGNYGLPAKALFHTLLGDNSSMLQWMLPTTLSRATDKDMGHTVWRCDSKQLLQRIVWNSIDDRRGSKQCIEKMINNRYYSFTQTSPELRILFGILKRIQLRYVIYSVDARSSGLAIYYNLERGFRSTGYLLRKMLRQILLYRVEALNARILHAEKMMASDPRKIASSIKLYGLITKFDSDQPSADEVQFDSQVKFISIQMFFLCYMERVNFEINKYVHMMLGFFVHISKLAYDVLKGNTLWMGLLLLSILFNLFLAGRATYSYWEERGIEKYANQLSQTKGYMQRAISISDMNELLEPRSSRVSYNASTSRCFKEFAKAASLSFNHDEVVESSSMTDGLVTLRLKRNELLSQINVLNNIERSYIYKAWQDWVLREYKTCQTVKMGLPEKYDADLNEYCLSVHGEMEYLYHELL